jgi:hypothetical protein
MLPMRVRGIRRISPFRKNIEAWMGVGATCFTQTFNTGPKYRGNNGVIMKEVTLYPAKAAVIATQNCEAQRYDIALTERIETAKAGLAAFISVKQREMMRNAQLETGSQSVGKNTCIAGTCIDASEARGWALEGFSVFFRAPHYISYKSRNFTYQDRLLGTYESTAWYHLQLVLN